MTRARRTRLIRSRVITGAVALFVAAWLVIAITLMKGNDPSLSSNRTIASAVTTSNGGSTAVTTRTSGSAGTTTSTGSAGASSTGSGTSNSSSGTSSVSTHQS